MQYPYLSYYIGCCDCLIWDALGGDPSGKTPPYTAPDTGCFFSTHYDTQGVYTVTATLACGTSDTLTVTVCDRACEFCCEGKCCNCCNCEICKNGSCVVAKPTNMQQTYVEDIGGGTLYFEYEWDSTTGYLSDLGMCGVREKVDYPDGNPYYWPSPPWDGSVDNPTILPVPFVPATEGGLEDEHSPPDFKKPYCVAYSCATQEYQYRCYCMPDWETLLSIGSIERFVTPPGGVWKYTIFKSGAYAEIFPLP